MEALVAADPGPTLPRHALMEEGEITPGAETVMSHLPPAEHLQGTISSRTPSNALASAHASDREEEAEEQREGEVADGTKKYPNICFDIFPSQFFIPSPLK